MAELIASILTLTNSLMSHFFEGSIRFEQMADHEWVMYGSLVPTEKTHDLTGAIADIIVYMAISTDELVQVLAKP